MSVLKNLRLLVWKLIFTDNELKDFSFTDESELYFSDYIATSFTSLTVRNFTNDILHVSVEPRATLAINGTDLEGVVTVRKDETFVLTDAYILRLRIRAEKAGDVEVILQNNPVAVRRSN